MASETGSTELFDGPAKRGPFGDNSKGGLLVPNLGQDGQNSKNLGGETKKGSNSWASLFGSTSSPSMTYTPPSTVGEKIVVTPYEEIISQGVRVWENSLVRQLIDAKLSYPVI